MNARGTTRYNADEASAMTWIVADREHLGGKPRVAGTRISIEFLLECLACGMTIPEIVEEYPTLTEEAIKGALEELAHSDRIATP
jgi:uncharacterized protein (DUF433 family)